MICPTCKRKGAAAPEQNPFRPFCSDRCRLVDLGAWLDGAHRITAPLSDEDLDSAVPGDRDDNADRN